MKKLIASLIAFCMMVVSVPAFVLAKAPADVTTVTTPAAFLKAAQSMMEQSSMFRLTDKENLKVDLSDTFQTGRILVQPGKALPADVLNKADSAICYNGLYLLQYKTKKATKAAYKALKEAYGADSVLLDRLFKVDLPKASAVSAKAAAEYKSWGIKNMGLDKLKSRVKARGYKTKVKVAVLDTGISFMESALQKRVTDAFDCIAFTTVPQDLNGHGSHCAGTIVEATPSNVKIMPVKILTSVGWGSTLHIVLGLLYAQWKGADVVNLSLGSPDIMTVKPYDALLKNLAASGAVICCASGNEATDVKYSHPGNSKYVITIGALKSNNRVDRRYSNYGSKVDFACPGTDVNGYAVVFGLPATMTMTGTSMAAPHASAAAALVKVVHPNYNRAKVYSVFRSCAVDIEAKGKDPYAGWGRLDMSRYANRI